MTENARLILVALRVNQWVKNTLVFAAPVGAGVLFETQSLGASVLAFVSFSLIASALYVVNDIIDIEADRRHPRKRNRPIASGELSISSAWVMAGICVFGSLVIATLVLPEEFLWVLAAYVANTVLYSWWGKHVPTVDIMQVALGFVLRAVAGAAATGVPLSQWFMAAAMFGSLLMVAGKRSSELEHVREENTTRPVLSRYRVEYLHQIMVISAAALLLTYALWALADTAAPIRDSWALISFAPFVYSVFRYMYLSDTGDAEQPERLVLVDRGMQLGALAWVTSIVIGIYL
jgi:decaprenyl-phosphate phosphoribosyltransferase